MSCFPFSSLMISLFSLLLDFAIFVSQDILSSLWILVCETASICTLSFLRNSSTLFIKWNYLSINVGLHGRVQTVLVQRQLC